MPGRADAYDRRLKYGYKIYPDNIAGIFSMNDTNGYLFVDGDITASGNGNSWETAKKTIQEAVTAADAGDTIFVAGRSITALATDPVSYAETIIIPNSKPQLSLIGISRGRTQGGLPQVRIGAGSTAMLDVRSPGCLISNIGFNGASSNGGGIKLTDDGGATYVAFGTTIAGCHFKNCTVTANDGRTGGAIYTTSSGNAWQALISGNRFYKNTADIVVVGTGGSVPQDWVIEGNEFSGPAASVDANIYTGGDGINGLVVRGNTFSAMPALSAGQIKRYVDLTGSVGIMADNYFASIVSPTGSEVTFAAAGTGGKVPATMFMAGNYGETTTTAETGEIFRT